MESKIRWPSVFDTFDKLENPSGSFTWVPTPNAFKLNRKEIVCEGVLQELETSSSALYSPKYFIATKKYIYRFNVL